ncbi:hypothetical protein [Ruegeria marina]|uniref:Uncharacterized protein n=1 Tax=Ruegeria marina TaxID=639004 RepID=A0A1G6LJ08_9RHOB|nr:hypothetical protein [Ruegeria marina]SDC43268.1 hypothetical protein SAMN04488239_102257 [Ruegeria marina]
MFTLSLPFPILRNPLQSLFAKKAKAVQPTESEETSLRNRREFINEMLTRSPEAFASTYDIESAMLMFPERF